MTTCLGHILLAAMVDVNPTRRALLALFHEAIEERSTMVAPGGMKIGSCLELVGSGFLLCNEITYQQ